MPDTFCLTFAAIDPTHPIGSLRRLAILAVEFVPEPGADLVPLRYLDSQRPASLEGMTLLSMTLEAPDGSIVYEWNAPREAFPVAA